MRARGIACVCWLAGVLLAREPAISIADFEGPNPMAGWKLARDSQSSGAEGSLTLGTGHSGNGAALAYRFTCDGGSTCGAVAAMWSPAKPVPVNRNGALSLWIRADAEVKLAVLVRDKSEGTRRYPFEATSLEFPDRAEWHRVVVPLKAKSTGYGDVDHSGAPKSRAIAIGILVEARYPRSIRGTILFDDVELLDSPDQSFSFRTELPPIPPPKDSLQLRPRLGVNIHVLGDDHLLDLAHEAGFSFIRADLLWRDVERNGRFRFGTYDRLLRALEAKNMSALWILDYGHPQHGVDAPRSKDDVAAFALFSEATAGHFKGRNVRYEVWNEPNTERFWPPSPNAVEYATLLREAVAAIHRADPLARVASGGLARMDLPFLEDTIAAGALPQVNAAAVHPYRKAGPESLASELPLFRNFLTHAIGSNVEIWDTEWGYASYDYFSQNLRGDGHSAPGRKRQAVLACREALTVWALGLPIAVWYDIRDDGDDPKNPEHNYGLLDASNADKPAMKAIRTLMKMGADHTLAGLLREVPDGIHAVRLDGGADRIFAVWSDQPDARITMEIRSEGLLAATNLFDEPLKLKSETQIVLSEVDGPVFLKFKSK